MCKDSAPRTTLFITAVTLSLLLSGCQPKPATGTGPQAQTPEQELQSFRLSEDFKVEPFLHEPQVMSPTEMVFDENGRIYVAEMLDYPEDPPAGQPARSQIRLLDDKDSDGKYETVVIFADHVLQVSSILPWKGGLLVTSAPDILWLKDNDGDGRADERKVLYTGFPQVNPEARITNLRFGIDNWIYTSNNGREGMIIAPAHPERAPLSVRGTDFRFHMIRDTAETTSGVAQFGLTFDDWGNEFITENTTHLRHVVLPLKYFARAPLLEVPAFALNIYENGRTPAPIFPLSEPQEWRRQRTALRQQRYDEQGLNRTEYVGGYFSGASGGTVYTGDAWPEAYRGSIFTGEVSANLIHRDVLTSDGVTFKAARAKEGTEFLASPDQWFRPCNFANAPDGNLYFMDIYRLFIETPESIPEEIKKGMDFYAGDRLGRIWRIVSNTPQAHRNLKPNLGSASVAELVSTLAHPNGWHRNTAQRLIVERQDKAAVPFLNQLAQQGTTAQGRIHALWTLEGLFALEPTHVLTALRDHDPHVREHALRLAETVITKSKPVQEAVLAMTSDTDVRVQFQLAFTLGELPDKRAFDALAELALKHADDRWFRLAILSSVNDRAMSFLRLLRARQPQFEQQELFAQIAGLIGARHDAGELAQLFDLLPAMTKPETMLNGLSRALRLAGVRNLQVPGAETILLNFLNSPSAEVQQTAWETARFLELRAVIQQAMANANNTTLSAAQRITAIRALRGGQCAAVAPALKKLITANEPTEIKVAAVESLSAFDDATIAPTLLSAWKSYTPEVRLHVLDALLTTADRMTALLKAVEEDQVERTALGEEMRARLYDHPDKATAARARQMFQTDNSDRAKVVQDYLHVQELSGNVAGGKAVFEQHCAKCHVPQRGGNRVGPDLSGISNRTKEELLTSILNPSYAIEPRFVNYIVTARDGRIYSGILANETPGAVTLRNVAGEETILRRNIKEIKASDLSLMPGVFEMLINKQQMADLLAYLRGGL